KVFGVFFYIVILNSNFILPTSYFQLYISNFVFPTSYVQFRISDFHLRKLQKPLPLGWAKGFGSFLLHRNFKFKLHTSNFIFPTSYFPLRISNFVFPTSI